jgi:uncharacterized membrane protein
LFDPWSQAPAAVVLIFVAFAKLGKKVVDSRLKFAITLASACLTLLVQVTEACLETAAAAVLVRHTKGHVPL